MKYRYLVFTGFSVWGKTDATLTKEYFTGAIARGDYIVDLENSTYFDKDTNSWLPVERDT